jgi:hypothetical protein
MDMQTQTPDAGADAQNAPPPTADAGDGGDDMNDDGGEQGQTVQASLADDPLIAGFEELFVSGGLRDADLPSVFAPRAERQKIALAPDFKGDIPRLWAVAGEGAEMFLDRLPDCPDDPLLERVEQHVDEKQQIADELADKMDSVRELMVLLDQPAQMPGAPAVAVRQKTARDETIDPTGVTQVDQSAPAATQPGRKRPTPVTQTTPDVDPEAYERQQQEQKGFQDRRMWLGWFQATVGQLHALLQNLQTSRDQRIDQQKVSSAVALLQGVLTPELREQYKIAANQLQPVQQNSVDEKLIDILERMDKLVHRIPQGLQVNTDAIGQAEQLLRGAPRHAMVRQSVAFSVTNIPRALTDELRNSLYLIGSMFAFLSDEERSRITDRLDELVTEVRDLAHDARTAYDRERAEDAQTQTQPSPQGVAPAGGLRQAFVEKCDGEWCVEDHEHHRIPGGKHKTKEEADAQLRAIEYHKHHGQRAVTAGDPPFSPKGAETCSACQGEGCRACGGYGVKPARPPKRPPPRPHQGAIEPEELWQHESEEPEEQENEPETDEEDQLFAEDPEVVDGPDAEPAIEPEEMPPEAELGAEPGGEMLEIDLAPATIPMPFDMTEADPMQRLMDMLPEAEQEVDLDHRIDEHVAEGEELRRLIGDEAERTLDQVRRFVGQN